MIQGILFDAGGTLIRMEPEVSTTIYVRIQEHGVTEEEVSKAYKKAAKEFYQTYYSQNIDTSRFWAAFIQSVLDDLGIEEELGEEIYNTIKEKTEFVAYPETSDVLKNLSSDYTLGIVSNWDLEVQIGDVLEELDLRKYFSTIVVSNELKVLKPNPQIFLKALENIQLAPSQCFYVGDDPYEDFYGAKNVGLIPLLLDREGEYDALDSPKISDLKEIHAYLERDRFL